VEERKGRGKEIEGQWRKEREEGRRESE